MWTDVRNFLRPFKGIHKDYLSGYIAIYEFNRNLKRLSSDFIASLVTLHTFCRWARQQIKCFAGWNGLMGGVVVAIALAEGTGASVRMPNFG